MNHTNYAGVKTQLPLILRSIPILLMIVFFEIACSSAVMAQSTDTVTNRVIIQLQKAGLGKAIITAKINSSPCNFDLSTGGLVVLKKNGVPDDVVAVMITKGNSPAPAPQNVAPPQNNAPDPNASQGQGPQTGGGESSLQPGLYYFDASTNNYGEIDPAFLANKTSGFGERVLTSYSPMFNAKTTECLKGVEANLKVSNHKPLFVVVIDPDNKTGPNVRNMNDFVLIRLKQGKKDREIVVAKTSSISSQGIDPKMNVDFTYSKVMAGIYEVSAKETLSPGEYCFMYTSTSDQGNSYTGYDFSIR
jgi:hypothetical protein